MPRYIIDIDDECDKKLCMEFPDPMELFRKVIADAVQCCDMKAAAAMCPKVERIEESEVIVTKEPPDKIEEVKS